MIRTTIVLTLFLLISAQGCSIVEKRENRVLAKIGDYAVTENEFKAAFLITYRRTGSAMPVNSVSKKAVLDREFNQFVLATHACEVGIDKDARSTHEMGMLERKILTDEYLKVALLDTLKPDERLSRELFRRSKTYLRASHIFTESKHTADSVYEVLKLNPEKFGEIARQAFKNPVLSKNEGDLGLFTVDEMDMAFEERAYRMKVGEISAPVKTAYGYSIIKVTGVFPEPVITETQFLNAKPVFDQLAEKRLAFMTKDLHLDDVIAAFSFDDQAISRLWTEFESQKGFPDGTEFLAGKQGEDAEPAAIAHSSDQVFSSADYYRELFFTPVATRAKISNRDRFSEMIKGLVYRNYVSLEARKLGLHKTFRFQKQLEYAFAAYLDNRVEESIREMIEITPEEIEDARKSINPEEFLQPEMLKISRIVLDSKEKSLEAIRKLESGLSFEEAVRKYSLDYELQAYGGDMGLISVKDLGTMAPKLTKVKTGGLSEPIEYQTNRFHVYKVFDRIPARLKTPEETAQEIAEMLRNEKVKSRKLALIEETKRARQAYIDLEHLNTMKLEL